MKKRKTFEFELEDLAEDNTPQVERLKIQAKLKKNKNLARVLLVLSKINPCASAYLSSTMTNTFKTDFPKANVYYLLNTLTLFNLVSVVKISDLDAIPEKVAKQIKERHKQFLNKIPVAFRKNYSYSSSMKYYWVTQLGDSFLEFCFNNVLNGDKKKEGEK